MSLILSMRFKDNIDYKITDERRAEYRRSSIESARAKREAMSGSIAKSLGKINSPLFDPQTLMPKKKKNALRALSLFSGGGGLDLGFECAGFEHVASYDIIAVCGETLRYNRPKWEIYAGDPDGDVRNINWDQYAGKVDIVHGGPPCQPFSIAGQQAGIHDPRNMWGSFVEVVNLLRPIAFIAENVRGMLHPRFSSFVEDNIISPLSEYKIRSFTLNAAGFGVPQKRERVFFVGFLSADSYERYLKPAYTHTFDHLRPTKKDVSARNQPSLLQTNELRCMGVREALGLPEIGRDILAPTLRSAFTGKRNTTSILNSSAAAKSLASIEVWGSGVGKDRVSAQQFPTRNGHFRLSVQDCALLQGFPDTWEFQGAVYKILGQIGNSVAPPVGYRVAESVSNALGV